LVVLLGLLELPLGLVALLLLESRCMELEPLELPDPELVAPWSRF